MLAKAGSCLGRRGVLGRTATLKKTVIVIPQIVANITVGATADHIFEPFVGREEVRFPAVATFVGNGPLVPDRA